MGYRLDINYLDNEMEVKNIYYGTKLYGYNLELDKSLSYQFLKTIHKFTGEEYFDYNCYNEIILNTFSSISFSSLLFSFHYFFINKFLVLLKIYKPFDSILKVSFFFVISLMF